MALDDTATVRGYNSLSLVGWAFRCIKTADLQVRPVYHRLADRVRTRVFLCMLASCLVWDMHQRVASMLFDNTDKQAAEALRVSVVAQAQCSLSAVAKQTTGLAKDGMPVHSFHTLLGDLATFAATPSQPRPRHPYPLTVFTRPTPIHHKVCDLLDVSM